MNAILSGWPEGVLRFIAAMLTTRSHAVLKPLNLKLSLSSDFQPRTADRCCSVAYCSLSLPVLGKGNVRLFPLIAIRQFREATHAYVTFVITEAD
jgi:hypothetical protein